MNWTISLRARAEGQALCKTERMRGWRQRGRPKEIRQGLMERRWGILVSQRDGLQKKNDGIFCQLGSVPVTENSERSSW